MTDAADLIARLSRVILEADMPNVAQGGGRQQVLEYLGLYTHRVAIANCRLIGIDDTQVAARSAATLNAFSHVIVA